MWGPSKKETLDTLAASLLLLGFKEFPQIEMDDKAFFYGTPDSHDYLKVRWTEDDIVVLSGALEGRKYPWWDTDELLPRVTHAITFLKAKKDQNITEGQLVSDDALDAMNHAMEQAKRVRDQMMVPRGLMREAISGGVEGDPLIGQSSVFAKLARKSARAPAKDKALLKQVDDAMADYLGDS